MAPNVAPDVAPLFTKDRTSTFMPPTKKRSNPIALVLMVVILLLIGTGVVRNLTAPRAVAETVRVVGAAVDIAPGTRLNFHSLHYVELPKQYVTPDLMMKSSEAFGRVSKVFIARGEPIPSTDLFLPNQTLSSMVETHERAVSLKLSDDSLVDHNLYPGDVVDVLVTSTKDSKKYTKTVCQQVRVLLCVTKDALMSTQMRSDDRDKVTLAVSPEQAEMLAQAQETGKVRLALRNHLATRQPRLAGISENDLLPAKAFLDDVAKKVKAVATLPFLPAPPPPVFSSEPQFAPPPLPVKDPLKWVVEVFSGSKKEVHEFDQTAP